MVAGVGAGMSGRQSSKSRYTKERPFCLTATTKTIKSTQSTVVDVYDKTMNRSKLQHNIIECCTILKL
jgi:hypothetical protein